jgi:4-amino-4-deoxy-L-arabinose transferase-like glycosyltransferase
VSTTHRLLLALILLAYAVLGGLYAVYTPPWQVPDEPAHYNYVRAVVQDGALPVMESGDYDQAYLERLTAEGFPPDLSVASVTYEDHQPPLYYLLAALVYLLFDGALLPLRLLSVALGLALLLVAHDLVRILFPERPSLALMVTALIAFLPQHLAMMAGVENDALAELLLAAALWMAVRYVKEQAGGRPFLVGWGITLGLILLTKVSAYVALPVALLAVWMRARGGEDHEGRPRGSSLKVVARDAGLVLLAAILLAGPWLARNVATYGWSDPLATARHNAVVEGQPRTVEWLAAYGWTGLGWRMARTTFQSFWGQFGWMGVPLHEPIYLVLLLFGVLLGVGFLGWLLDRRRPRLTLSQARALWLLAASAALTLLLYLAYNVTFVQHQGRYLFPALIPLALGAGLGLEWLFSVPRARWAAAGLGGLVCLFVVWGLVRGDLPVVPTGGALILLALCGLAWLWPRRGKDLALAGLAVGLVVLDLYCLFGAIVPALAR